MHYSRPARWKNSSPAWWHRIVVIAHRRCGMLVTETTGYEC
jgi:hypothetical protein